VKFNAANIEAFGGKLIQAVGAEITSARRHLNEEPREVESGAFTTFGEDLAHAYVQAVEYACGDRISPVYEPLDRRGRVWGRLRQQNQPATGDRLLISANCSTVAGSPGITDGVIRCSGAGLSPLR
jgi:hypothetical protein